MLWTSVKKEVIAMGFFSKLFGNENKDGKSVTEFLSGLFNTDTDSNSSQNQSAPSQAAQSEKKAPLSGFSWGEEMPQEECQFNFDGNYRQYFDTVFRSEFPQYDITWSYSDPRFKSTDLCTFVKDGKTALVVELMSKGSNVKKTRNHCRQNGISYLRYYYDHHGWWNTRAYVVSRTKQALSL